jgi:hypothetical protein
VRALAATAAFVLVACTLLVGWHRATVTHGVCAEHGGDLHLDKVAEHACAHDSDADQVDGNTWELRDGDHHCQILATSRDPLSAPAAATAAAAPDPFDDGAAPPPALAAPAGLARYRLAPKTSPPV